jgi:hypothetical protein
MMTDITKIQEKLRVLADFNPTEMPYVTAYVDLSPELDAGTRPFGGGSDDAPLKSWRRTEEADLGHVRPGIRLLRDLLREKEDLFEVRGPERESFDKDRDRILEFLEDSEFDNSSRSIVIFACAGEGIWEVLELAVPIPTQASIDRTPLLYPLARALDAYERFALCIADSQSARVYTVAMGRLDSEESVGGPTINYKMTGGLSQRRIQQRIENAVSDHVRDVANRLEELVFQEDIPRIVLGGDEIMLTEFKNHLSDRAWDRVVTVERLDIRLPQDEAVSRAMEAVQNAERLEARDLARQARDNSLAGGLGAFGEKPVRHALDQGAVDILLMDPTFSNRETRDELATTAISMGGRIEFVEESEDLKRMHGIAALLRWNPDTLPHLPSLKAEVEKRPATPEEALAQS